uniref:Uncharacterized protein n=1 Tax=Arundo donax TaxID=35708 RepID=A0A0A9CID2_ARUDO
MSDCPTGARTTAPQIRAPRWSSGGYGSG